MDRRKEIGGTSPEIIFEVHGSLTFSGCHSDLDSKFWWFGFDCVMVQIRETLNR